MKKINFFLLIAMVFMIAISSSCSKSDNTYTPPTNTDQPVAAIPTITDFAPTVAKTGATITITGSNFGTDGTVVGIKFGNSGTVYPTGITNTQLTVVVPNDATSGPIAIAINNKYFLLSKSEFAVDHSVTTVDYSSYNVLAYTESATLSVPRFSLAAAGAGDKILFAGGSTDIRADGASAFNYRTACTDVVDIYNATTGTWTTSKLSEARSQLVGAAAGNKIVFAGGLGRDGYSKTVDIYDVTTGLWSTAQLKEARAGLAATVSGNKIYFAGGMSLTALGSNTVDIYDVVANSWSSINLTNTAYDLGAASAGGKVAFVGGAFVGVNDIYTVTSLDHDFANRTGDKSACRGAGNANKMIFVGMDKVADIYNASNNQWSTKTLGQVKGKCAAVSGGTKIAFAGGEDVLNENLSNSIDVYDVTTDSWTTLSLTIARSRLAAATTANKVIFAGGANGTAIFNTVDIFTLTKQ